MHSLPPTRLPRADAEAQLTAPTFPIRRRPAFQCVERCLSPPPRCTFLAVPPHDPRQPQPATHVPARLRRPLLIHTDEIFCGLPATSPAHPPAIRPHGPAH